MTYSRLDATPAALDLIAKLQTQHGDLMFHQSGGCCDGSAPAAASVIAGRPANGRTSWKTVDTKISYAQWQEQQIDNETNQLNNQPELLSTE